MSPKEQLQSLLEKHLAGYHLPALEKRMLSDMLDDPDLIKYAEQMIQEDLEAGTYDSDMIPEVHARLHARLNELVAATGKEQPALPRVPLYKRSWLRYAAAAVIVIGMLVYVFNSRTPAFLPGIARKQPAVKQNDVMPGSDKATLTLSNGNKVELGAQGTINDGKLAITNSDGELVYSKADVTVFNTMTTPRGGQYKLTLADGTRVWLNAASSITFPTTFKDKHRNVSITGEAYFEVQKDASRPFIVTVNGSETIEVLGTHFNVNGYKDEHVTITTLLEGSVKIGDKTLQPGQACVGEKVVEADVNHAVAWKNGYFSFKSADLRTVMRQLSRWYDVEIEYAGDIPQRTYSGEIGRKLTLQQVLKGLTKTKVKYEINNGRIIILP